MPWDNIWFGLFIGTIIQGLAVVSYGLWAYEEGRKKVFTNKNVEDAVAVFREKILGNTK